MLKFVIVLVAAVLYARPPSPVTTTRAIPTAAPSTVGYPARFKSPAGAITRTWVPALTKDR
ncbi:hypothetical protein CPB86DRAFT_782677 [Serendipita vermifera]|nr:hypothetical protein CPB86DRAFT_782677 [Serendipita vermifera]